MGAADAQSPATYLGVDVGRPTSVPAREYALKRRHAAAVGCSNASQEGGVVI